MWDYFLLGFSLRHRLLFPNFVQMDAWNLKINSSVRSRNVKDTSSDGAQYLRRKILSAPLREPVNLHIIWKVYMILVCELVTATNVKITLF